MAISYANSGVYYIMKGFVYSPDGDYSVFGGNKKWVDVITAARIHWSIYGFVINRSWISGFVGGGVSVIVGAFVALYLN